MPTGPGAGATITWGDIATSTLDPEVVDVAWSNISRNSIDMTNYGSPTANALYAGTADIDSIWMEKKPGAIINPGQLRVDILHDPDLKPLIGEAPKTFVVTFPSTDPTQDTPAAWSVTGFVVDSEFNLGGLDDKMAGTLTIELTGAMAFTVQS